MFFDRLRAGLGDEHGERDAFALRRLDEIFRPGVQRDTERRHGERRRHGVSHRTLHRGHGAAMPRHLHFRHHVRGDLRRDLARTLQRLRAAHVLRGDHTVRAGAFERVQIDVQLRREFARLRARLFVIGARHRHTRLGAHERRLVPRCGMRGGEAMALILFRRAGDIVHRALAHHGETGVYHVISLVHQIGERAAHRHHAVHRRDGAGKPRNMRLLVNHAGHEAVDSGEELSDSVGREGRGHLISDDDRRLALRRGVGPINHSWGLHVPAP